MAIMKMKYSNAKSGYPQKHIKRAIAYILNPDKTTDKNNNTYIDANMCIADPELATEAFMQTKEQYEKTTGRQFYHFIISFAPGEIEDPGEAMEISQKWAEKKIGNYEYVISTHLDKEHIHTHIVFNSVAYTDGKMFHYKKGAWERDFQPYLDELCENHGLSSMRTRPEKAKDKGKKDNYAWHQAQKDGKWSWWDVAKHDIDMCIDAGCESYEDVRRMLEKDYGYEFPEDRTDRCKPPGKARNIRFSSLGENYTPDNIEKRCKYKKINREHVLKQEQKPKSQEEQYRRIYGFMPPPPRFKAVRGRPKRREFTWMEKQEYRVLQFFGLQKKKEYRKKSPEYWATVKKYRKEQNQLLYLIANGIKDIDGLNAKRTDLWVQKRALTKARDNARKGTAERNGFNARLTKIEDELHVIYGIQNTLAPKKQVSKTSETTRSR